MSRWLSVPALVALSMLAACGVDGPPERPEPAPGPASRPEIEVTVEGGSGISIGATASIGVRGGSR